MKLKIRIVALIILISMMFSIGFVYADDYNKEVEETQVTVPEPVRGKVLKLISEEPMDNEGMNDYSKMIVQDLEIEIKSGKHKGEIHNVQNFIDESVAYNIIVKEGDNVLLYTEEDESGNLTAVYVSDKVRDNYIYFIGALFFILLIILGGKKGVKSVITLILTGASVLYILLPLTLKGYSPALLSILICIGVIIVTLILISGLNKKTLSSIIGTSGGVLVAGIITLIVSSLADLTGLASQEAQMLMFIPQKIEFNFQGILFAGIILGALGAVMDISMSIASSMNEINLANPEMTSKDLFKAGMNVGRDVMGTMSNTLILAYAGGSLHLMLLFTAYDLPLIDIINRDIVASEILRALAGSIGLIFAIPITALVSSTFGREKYNK